MLSIIIYLVVISLLLWIIIDCDKRYILKIFSIILVCLFSLYLNIVFESLKGSPIKINYEKISNKELKICAVFIVEPSETKEGGIFFVLREDTKYKFYQLPYDREMHEEAQKISSKLAEQGAANNEIQGYIEYKNKVPGFYELPPPHRRKD